MNKESTRKNISLNEWKTFDLVVIGVSTGGARALRSLLSGLPRDFNMSLAVVQHVSPHSDGSWATMLDTYCAIRVREAEEKEPIMPGTAYLAPANYHLLMEADRSFSFTVDEPVNYSRPSIDVLFETAAEVVGSQLIGIVMTGANSDGAKGLLRVGEKGGLTIVQDPDEAEAAAMPKAAIQLAEPDHILPLEGIRDLLVAIHDRQRSV